MKKNYALIYGNYSVVHTSGIVPAVGPVAYLSLSYNLANSFAFQNPGIYNRYCFSVYKSHNLISIQNAKSDLTLEKHKYNEYNYKNDSKPLYPCAITLKSIFTDRAFFT